MPPHNPLLTFSIYSYICLNIAQLSAICRQFSFFRFYLCVCCMRDVPPFVHREVSEVRWFRAPEVWRQRLERKSEYVPCTWDVEERQEESQLQLPSPKLAHSLWYTILYFFICPGFDGYVFRHSVARRCRVGHWDCDRINKSYQHHRFLYDRKIAWLKNWICLMDSILSMSIKLLF